MAKWENQLMFKLIEFLYVQTRHKYMHLRTPRSLGNNDGATANFILSSTVSVATMKVPH